MTSERKKASNRSNAAASTGPRTPFGKARASRNALKHGFNVPLIRTQDDACEIERLARAIAGDQAPAGRLEIARAYAEAELELLRVRNHKISLVNARLARRPDKNFHLGSTNRSFGTPPNSWI